MEFFYSNSNCTMLPKDLPSDGRHPSTTTKQMSYTISNRDEDNYIPHDHGIPVEESRDTTDLVTFPRGSYGARRVVLLGEDRKENTEMGLVVMETDLERLHLP